MDQSLQQSDERRYGWVMVAVSFVALRFAFEDGILVGHSNSLGPQGEDTGDLMVDSGMGRQRDCRFVQGRTLLLGLHGLQDGFACPCSNRAAI